MKKKKSKYLLAIIFALILLGGSVFYILKYRFSADTAVSSLNNQVTITYTDQNQKNVTFYATSSTEKVSIPSLTLDSNIDKRRAPANVTILDSSGTNIDQIVLSFDDNNKAQVDWTAIDSVNPSVSYNLLLKIPGYLGKQINSVDLDSSAEIDITQLDAGNANGDKIVDINDFGMLMSSWGLSDINIDFDGNGVVDIGDFSALMSSWGKTES